LKTTNTTWKSFDWTDFYLIWYMF